MRFYLDTSVLFGLIKYSLLGPAGADEQKLTVVELISEYRYKLALD
jgi:hypothetical protein